MTRVGTVRLVLLLLSLCLAMTACSDDSGGDTRSSGEKPADVEKRATQRVQEAVPLALEAVSGTKAEIRAQWRSCMPELSYQYEGDGLLTAPEAQDENGLEAIRSALVDAGWRETVHVPRHVNVERDGVTLDVREPGAGYGPGRWRVRFHTECLTYSGEDKTAVENDEAGMLPGLDP